MNTILLWSKLLFIVSSSGSSGRVSVNDDSLFRLKYKGSSHIISNIDYAGLDVGLSFSTEKLDPIYGQLKSINPFFDDIRYENNMSILSVQSSFNGDVTEIKGALTNRIHEKIIQKNNDLIISYKDNFYKNSKKVESISYYMKGIGSWNTEKDRFLRASQFNRNKKGHVDKILNLNIKWNLINPTQFTREDGSIVKNYFNALGEFRFSCKTSGTGEDEECFVRITDNDFLIGGTSVHYIKVNNDVKGIVIKNENGEISYYYALTDSLGSLVGLLDKNLDPIFARQYSKFGSFETIILNKELGENLDKLVTLAFAGLHKNPYLDYNDNGAQVLHSRTRLYLPQIKEWASVDPMIYLNPKALLMKEGDISPFRYGKGDPLIFVDPSGYFSHENKLSAGFGDGTGAGVSARVARDYNIEHGTHDVLSNKDAAVVIGSDYVAPITEFTPINNLVRGIVGVDPLDNFNKISPQERSSAIVQELVFGGLRAAGKVGMKAYHMFMSMLDFADKVDTGYEVYKAKKDERY